MIKRENNRIIFQGAFYIGDLLPAMAVLHQGVVAGFQDLVLDFSACEAAFAPPVLGLCAQVMKLRTTQQIEFELVLPDNQRLATLFRNANWAHFLSPEGNLPSQFRGFTKLPATQFRDSAEQSQAVNRISNAILGAIPDLDRRELSALEWSVNEITDNVLVHAHSPIGGLVQVSSFERATKRIEYIVVDAGIGIPCTLRQSHPQLPSDAAALESAIQKGVTRDKALGQGNGLYGSYRVCSHSRGSFYLESGRGKLSFTTAKGLKLATETVPFDGTLVAAQINFSDPQLLAEALQFGDRPHVIVDFVELHYEQHDRDEVLVVLKKETNSFGSRIAGTPIRNKILNLVRMCPGQRIIVNFEDIHLISSSFADEVMGKLFKELGPMTFAQRLEFRNVESTVQQLLDKAIMQRMSS